jgi:transposase InsO family protein
LYHSRKLKEIQPCTHRHRQIHKVDSVQVDCRSNLIKAVEFIQEIIFRFRIPNNIITNLGSNFTRGEFFNFCEQRSIKVKYASVAHSKANGHVERANRMILEALRKKIFDKNEKLAGKWIRELPYVV